MSERGDTSMLSFFGAARAWEERLESALGGVGLSIAKLKVLTELVHSDEPLPLGELASRLSCVRSNMTQLIDRLEADGLVHRVHDANDRRSVRAAITTTGEERQAAGAEEMTRIAAEFAEQLSSTERASLTRILSTLG
jgi:DNA-binding MarR family transcriptional regulator